MRRRLRQLHNAPALVIRGKPQNAGGGATGRGMPACGAAADGAWRISATRWRASATSRGWGGGRRARGQGAVVAPSVAAGAVVGSMSSLMRTVRSRYCGGMSAAGAGGAGGGGSAVTSVS